ncbi:MAG: hypothetical protein IRY99_20845 [Isosphaeraceae bacterium]|nr:hypothetical protein [Isosphaeraceae bacterium]
MNRRNALLTAGAVATGVVALGSTSTLAQDEGAQEKAPGEAAPRLSKKYIDLHRERLHTPESFTRALVEQLLNAAQKKVGGREAQSVTVDVKMTLTPTRQGCIQLCADIPIDGAVITVYYHVPT